MKPVAYVSGENYVALAGALAEFEFLETGEVSVHQSSPSGAFHADLPAGIVSPWREMNARLDLDRYTLPAAQNAASPLPSPGL